MEKYIEYSKELLANYTPKVLTALAILIVGLFVTNLVVKVVKSLMKKQKIDITVQKFSANFLRWTLYVLLFVAITAKLGIETTSFATIIGAAGLAIGLALQGALSNFAGGTLIMIFKPFKIDDLIEAQGVLGTVKEITIFTTKLNTIDNRLVILPNGALSNGIIINYSEEKKRRVDLTFGVSYDADIKEAKQVLMNVLVNHPLVLEDPAPEVAVSELADSSVNFVVRPWINSEDYWTVYFDIVENTKLALDKAGIEIPYPHTVEIKR